MTTVNHKKSWCLSPYHFKQMLIYTIIIMNTCVSSLPWWRWCSKAHLSVCSMSCLAVKVFTEEKSPSKASLCSGLYVEACRLTASWDSSSAGSAWLRDTSVRMCWSTAALYLEASCSRLHADSSTDSGRVKTWDATMNTSLHYKSSSTQTQLVRRMKVKCFGLYFWVTITTTAPKVCYWQDRR